MSRPLGSVRELSPGRWLVQISIQVDGKQERSTRRVTGTQRDAEMAKLTMLQQLDGAATDVPVNNRVTFGAYIEQTWLPFMFSKAQGKRSPATAMEHQSRLTLHVLPYPVAKVLMCDLNARTLDQWMAQLRRARPDLGERTLHHIYSKVGTACRQAVRWELLAKDPTANMGDIPQPRDYEAHPLKATEANTLAAAFWDHPLGTGFGLVLGMGLMPAEVCALRWRDFDLEAGTVKPLWDVVPLDKSHGGGVTLRQTKTPARAQSKRLPHWVLDMVVAYRRSQMQRNVALGTPDALLFTDTKGQPMRPTFLSKQFTRLRISLGLPEMRLYDLRHGNARLLKAAGVDIHDVSKRLRHSRITTTSRYYLGEDDATDQHCADVLDTIITLPRREAEA